MRKKLIGFLAVLTCFVFLTACGSSAQNEEVQEIPQETQSLLYSNTEMTAQQMDQVVADWTARLTAVEARADAVTGLERV